MPSKNIVNTIIIDKAGSFLTIKRTKTAPRHALHWDLPGGHVEEGESLEKAAVREAFEETNLKIEDLRPAKVKNSFRNYFITTKYSGNIEFKKNPESGFVEHNEYKWVTLEQYKKLPNLSINPKEIEKAMEILSKKALYEQKYQERMMFLLKEGRKENVFKKYSRLGEEYLDFLAKADEENNFKHLAWMAKQLSKDTDWDNYSDYGKLEATKDMAKYLEKFLEYQPRLKRKDINQYKNGDDIIMAIHKEVLQPQIDRTRKKRAGDPRTQQMVERGEGRIIYEDDTFFVVRPETTDASCFFGAQSSWCIAQLGNSYFSHHTEEEGKVFYFIKNDGLRTDDDFRQMAVQMSREHGFEMFWDRHDEPYELYTNDWEEFAEFVHTETEMPLKIAEAMFEEIYEDFEDNPPTGGQLVALSNKVDNGDYDTKYAKFSAEYDDWSGEGHIYMSPSCYVTLQVSLSDNDYLNDFISNIYERFGYPYTPSILAIRIDDVLNGKTNHTDFNDNEYEIELDDITYPALSELGFQYPEENLEYSKRERLQDIVDFKIKGSPGEWYAEISFSQDYAMYTLDESLTADADDAERYFESLSSIYDDDADFSGVVDYIMMAIPELNVSEGSLEKIYDDFYDRSEKFKNIELSFDISLPEDGVGEIIMKSKPFYLPSPKGEMRMSFYEYRENLKSVVKETFDEFYEQAFSKQKQFDFGKKYELQSKFAPEYDVSIERETFGRLRGQIKTKVSYMQTPEVISEIYDFFSTIEKYFPQIEKMLVRQTQEFSKFLNMDETLQITEKKKKKKKSSGKKDACYHKVKSRYKVWPSAYASGALVKCRKVGAKNWGNSKKEELEIAIHNEMSILEEAPDDALIKKIYSVLEKEGGAAGLDAIESQTGATSEEIAAVIEKELDIKVHDDGDIIDMSGLKDEISEEIKAFLNEKKKKKKKKAGTESSKESSLRDWFGRKGAKGGKSGWVDCNAPDGKGGYKACGRSSGEKRKKYPACRPTPGACKERGKGKSWGKKAKKKK